MLRAEKTPGIAGSYSVVRERQVVATATVGASRSGGGFHLDSVGYVVRPRSFGRSYDLLADEHPSGESPVATAEGVRGRLWTVHAGDRTHVFRPVSLRAREVSMLDPDGRQIGSITRPRRWGGGVVADLPGVELRVQVYVIVVVLSRWRRQRVAVTAALGATRG